MTTPEPGAASSSSPSAAPARRLGEGAAAAAPAGVRVILDARPLQDPERAPITAIYLRELLAAFARSPLPGESFVLLLEAGGAEPELPDGLPVAGRRPLPRTRVLRSGAMTLDPFFLRGASFLAGWRATRGGAAGIVYHAAGGFVPLGIRHPLVVSLLDLAAWELPDRYQQSPAARFGLRLRTRILRDAAAVIVPADATAAAARRLIRVPRPVLHVVRLAPRPVFRPDIPANEIAAARARHGLDREYLVYPGRYDARHDLPTLLRALALLRGGGAASGTGTPRLLLVGTSPDERAALARIAIREGVGESLSYAPLDDEEEVAALVAGAGAAVLPVLSDANGHPALEAIAVGTPVVASAIGALPEVVGGAGILVEPESPDRLAAGLQALLGPSRARATVDAAILAARAHRRTWDEVALATRGIYAEAAATAG